MCWSLCEALIKREDNFTLLTTHNPLLPGLSCFYPQCGSWQMKSNFDPEKGAFSCCHELVKANNRLQPAYGILAAKDLILNSNMIREAFKAYEVLSKHFREIIAFMENRNEQPCSLEAEQKEKFVNIAMTVGKTDDQHDQAKG